MAQYLTTSYVNTNIPGSYVKTTVSSTAVGSSSTGDVVIIGESDGGQDYTNESLKDNFFTADQLGRVKAKYLRGPIVDAMAALVSPSNDTQISGSAGRVYIVKTNGGTQSSALVLGDAGTYGTLADKNYGIDGNKYSYQTTQSATEVGPSYQGTVVTFGALIGLSFSFRGNGGTETVITLAAEHADITALVADIDGQLPAGFSCEEGSVADTLIFKSDTDATANQEGYGKSFELIDSTPADMAVIGLIEGLTSSSQEPEIDFSIKRQDTNTNESYTVKAEIALTIGYTGTTGTITISNGVLTTSVTGGTGSALNITLSEYTTMKDLAAFISSQDGYTATSIANSNNLAPIRLDELAAISIGTTNSEEPCRIKRSAYNMAVKLDQSSTLDFSFSVGAGLPIATSGFVFLTGGTKGGTTAADVIDAVTTLEGIKVNFVNPLFSRDFSEDIADGLTDSSSTYTIDAVNFAVKSHVLAMSTVKIKRNRIAMLSKYADYGDVKAHAQTLSSFRCTLAMQKSTQNNSEGVVTDFFPWYTAAISTGMQSAGFNQSLTGKFANVSGVKDPSGFDSGNQGDVSDAIDSGIMFLQTENAGVSYVIDQTTYGFDGNFVYNSMQAVYMSDVLSISLGDALQRFIVGQSTADITSAGVSAFISQKMDDYRRLKIIGASDDAPLGYKNLNIDINAPIVSISVEAKLATQILFVAVELELSSIQSSTAS